MSISKPLYKQLPELHDYMKYYMKDKNNYVSDSKYKDDCETGMKLDVEVLFYLTKTENRKTHDCCLMLAEEFQTMFFLEFQDISKATYMYIRKLNGGYSVKKSSAKKERDDYGVHANNDPCKQGFVIFNDT